MSEQMIPYEAKPELDIMTLGATLAKSGYFADAKEAAQAVVKILAGRELGIGPIASMSGINIINGKPAPSAGIIAAVIQRSGRYNYRIVRLDNEVCELAFYDGKTELSPHSVFTMQDASAADLTSGRNAHSWKHYKRNMLFSRALTNGARWHCPGLFAGPIYTPDELGTVIDGETGEVVEVTSPTAESTRQSAPESKPSAPADKPTNGKGHGKEPDLDALKRAFFNKVLMEIPYYNHGNHIINTLKGMGFGKYEPERETEMFAALQRHAHEKANEKAAQNKPPTLDEELDAAQAAAQRENPL